MLQHLDDEAIDGEETLYQSRVHGVTIIYENLMSEYKKVQKKISKRLMDTKVSCMRVENGSVSIMIDVNSTKYSGCFVAKVVVRREGGAYAEVKIIHATSVKTCIFQKIYLHYDTLIERQMLR